MQPSRTAPQDKGMQRGPWRHSFRSATTPQCGRIKWMVTVPRDYIYSPTNGGKINRPQRKIERIHHTAYGVRRP